MRERHTEHPFYPKGHERGQVLRHEDDICDKKRPRLSISRSKIADLLDLWLLYSEKSCRVARKAQVFVELFGARIEFTMTTTSDFIQSNW